MKRISNKKKLSKCWKGKLIFVITEINDVPVLEVWNDLRSLGTNIHVIMNYHEKE